MTNRDIGNFTIVRNRVINSRMSLSAIGLYVFLCSKPPEWKFGYQGLKAQLEISESTIRKYLKEIVDSQLLIRVAKKDKNGKYKGWDWILNPNPKDLKKLEHSDPFHRTLKVPKSAETEIPQNGSLENVEMLSNTNKEQEFLLHNGEKIPRYVTTRKWSKPKTA